MTYGIWGVNGPWNHLWDQDLWKATEICFLEIIRLKVSDAAANNITTTKYT